MVLSLALVLTFNFPFSSEMISRIFLFVIRLKFLFKCLCVGVQVTALMCRLKDKLREGRCVGVHRAVGRGGARSVPASRWVRSLWWDSAEDCLQLELEFRVCLYYLLSLGRWQPK